jgi:Transposase DDE domain
VQGFFDRWIATIPTPFTHQDRAAGYWWELSMRQVEVSCTLVFDDPRRARSFFEALVADNIGIGRPHEVSAVFARQVRRTTKGIFRTRVFGSGTEVRMDFSYKHSRVKQYLIGVATHFDLGGLVDADLDTLATALYVRIDDWLRADPSLAPARPAVGIAPKLSDAELVTLAVLQGLLGFVSEARWCRYVRAHLVHLFPYVPHQPGYNKRLRAASGLLGACVRLLGADTDAFADDTWVIDSTPVECGRSRSTAQRSELAGWAGYGYCASHSRYFWGLRLHLIATPAGLPIAFALANPKLDEREVARDLLESDPALLEARPTQVIIADKGYASKEFETFLAERGAHLIRPARTDEAPRLGARFLKPLRQLIESVNDTLKGQLDLERHGGRTPAGVIARVLQRLLALTAAIWHNHHSHQPKLRSLTAYDH